MSKIDIFTAEGDLKQYVPLSQRVPLFRERFPAEQGYRVVVETMSSLDTKPALGRLYERALEGGHSPRDVGLPGIPSEEVIFRASLISPEGAVLETASARREVVLLKDWEKGETAARQRLLAALGFGGEVFDADEDGDIADQGHRAQRSPSATPAPAETPRASDPSTTVAAPAGDEAGANPAPAAASASTAPSTEPASGDADDDEAVLQTQAGDGETIPKHILHQIRHQASVKGLEAEVPASFDSVSEAKALMKRLVQA